MIYSFPVPDGQTGFWPQEGQQIIVKDPRLPEGKQLKVVTFTYDTLRGACFTEESGKIYWWPYQPYKEWLSFA